MGVAKKAGTVGGRRVTPLARKLAARIRAAGPLSVSDYMAACLGDSEYGYYATSEPFGAAGDFVTAPEVSQVFGELIGLWAVATWEAMDAPRAFVLAELGPGRGTLMADALRAGRIRPAFLAAAELHLVETSRRLRAIQAATLAPTGIAPTWHAGVAGLPALPTILVANEFFDALPVRQFIRTAHGWAERMVGIGPADGLAFGLMPAAAFDGPPSAGQGSVVEVAPAASAIMETMCERLVASGGACLVIDYGYAGPATGDTLQALRRHRHDDPLAAPGEADLTAHVDFAALAATAHRVGACPAPLLTQGEFLLRLGLRERMDVLSRGKDEAAREALVAAAARLTGPDGMGTLFKVLGVAAPGLALPAFDDEPASRRSP